MDDTITGSYSVANKSTANKTRAKTTSAVTDQIIAQPIEQLNYIRQTAENNAQHAQDEAFKLAQQQIDNVRAFVGKPEHILGNNTTKHGEIAEQVEVGVHNAKQALYGQQMTANIDSVSRTSPIDYYIDGIPIQSKFINGANHNLDAVLQHINHNPDFIQQHGYYHIPKDHYETISKIVHGEQIVGLKATTQEAIKAKVALIEAKTGHSFDEMLQPSVSSYHDVQLGNIDNTLNRHDTNLYNENQQLKSNIHENHSASFSEGLYVSGVSAAVTASVSLLTNIYKKHKAGKSIFTGDYTTKDWQELGLNISQDAVTGGVTGAAIYTITNYADLSAPFAAAIVSASKAVTTLWQQHNNNEISKQEFYQLAMLSCSESAMVGLATIAGQTVIPIPVVGSILGAISGQILINLTKDKSSLATDIQQKLAEFTAQLNARQQQIFKQVDAKFKALGDLIAAAFDTSNNTILVENSIKLARYLGVAEDKIIKNKQELDDYILG